MKKNNLVYLLVIGLSFFVFSSCKKDKASDYKMISQGPVGEIMVVIDKKINEGALGDSIKELFATPYPGIPSIFGEGYFNEKTMPPSLFTGYAKRHRSVFQINIAEKARNILVKEDDAFAYNQRYMLVEAKSTADAMRIIGEHKQQILDYFDKGEIGHFAYIYKDQHTSFSKYLSDNLGIWLAAPEYSIKRKEKDFIWASRETKRTSQAVMIYEYPYVSQDQLTKEALIEQRDTFLKKYVEGPKEGTYMRTEKDQAPVDSKVVDINGYYGVELRGYWTLEGDFMGGPFLMIALVDEPNGRILVLDSYIFAPEANYSKVKFLRQIEGIFQTLRILPKE